MKSWRVSDCWSWQGQVNPVQYFTWGALLFALKYNLDKLVARLIFDRFWTLTSYFHAVDILAVRGLDPTNLRFYGVMLLIALPFIYTGVVLTIKRLRDAKLPAGLAALFFVPYLNLAFFILLSLIPSASDDASPHRLFNLKSVPTIFGSALSGLLLTVLLGLGCVYLSVHVLHAYGTILFIHLPFLLGMLPVLIFSIPKQRTIKECLLVAWLTTLILGLLLIALAFEGIICILMAAPLALLCATIGALLGYLIQKKTYPRQNHVGLILALILSIPVLMGAEAPMLKNPLLIPVDTTVEISAPPPVVWRHVISFTDLPAPTHWLFKAGVAYPTRARIYGHGVGAVRHCEFSTGPFIEPIEVWDEPHRLEFSIAKMPKPMQELSPYNIEPEHLKHYFATERGRFILTPLPNGHTRLTGTTWYRQNIWPNAYWQLWSNYLVHEIHLRVLDHIKMLSEWDPKQS